MKQNSSYEKNAAFYQAAYEPICVSEEMKSDLRRRKMKKSKNTYHSAIKAAAAMAATICLLFAGLVNGSTAFAASVGNVPVIGKIAQLIDFRTYSRETKDYKALVSIPAITVDLHGGGQDAERINAEISKICDQFLSAAEERAREYKKSFFEIGGTEEEWEKHNITITVDYEIKTEGAEFLSFVVYGYESWVSSEAVSYYYNLDPHTMETITLEDLLGQDYRSLANEEILLQIKERQEKENASFFPPEKGGFETISEDQKFYINTAGNVVIVFEKYEIAPGSMGRVEFEIAVP